MSSEVSEWLIALGGILGGGTGTAALNAFMVGRRERARAKERSGGALARAVRALYVWMDYAMRLRAMMFVHFPDEEIPPLPDVSWSPEEAAAALAGKGDG